MLKSAHMSEINQWLNAERPWLHAPFLPVLKRHVGDLHLYFFPMSVFPGDLVKSICHFLVDLGIPLGTLKWAVELLPEIDEGLHLGVGPVSGPAVLLCESRDNVAHTVIRGHFQT